MRYPLPHFTTFLLAAGLLIGCANDEGQDASPSPSSDVEARSGKAHEVEPEPLPALSLETLNGDVIETEELKGEVLLINFWATWCAPCRKEIPDLVSLQSELGPKGFTVIGVAVDRDGAEVVRPFLEDYDINYPIVIDADRSVEEELGPTYGLPTTLVVNPEGQITHRIVGIFPVEEMKPDLEAMLTS